MALITRFSRLFTADLNAVLDRLEEPEVLLKQAVRDMEEDIARTRGEAQALRMELQRLAKQDDDVRDRLTDFEEQLDVCFSTGEDTLARNLIRRKLETQRVQKMIAGKRDAAARRLADLDGAIAENDRHLQAMREKVELLVDQSDAPGAGETPTSDPTIGADEVEVEFLREQQRRARQ